MIGRQMNNLHKSQIKQSQLINLKSLSHPNMLINMRPEIY